MNKLDFVNTFSYKIIYVFRINDYAHKDCLKIGDTTLNTTLDFRDLKENSKELNYAARERINSYTATAGISYELLHTEIAAYDSYLNDDLKVVSFRDYDVHKVLLNSGIKKKFFDTNAKQNEWFVCDIETVKNAIKAVKSNKASLNNSEISFTRNPIVFRPEQADAIKLTLKKFKTGNRMLWNAKMRFGKTLTALQVIKESNFKRSIIITHRPVVNEGWFEDFKKIFFDRDDFSFGSKNIGQSIYSLVNSSSNYVYFASLQDLRGSDVVGGLYEKNQLVFDIDWDFVVVDEAHEGTNTSLGKSVLDKIIKNSKGKTKVLELSGTPFNLIANYEQQEIFTWDYIMEQEAKAKWTLEHFGDSNPYEDLPRLNIFTYHLEESFKQFIDLEDKAFNFKEFFRIWTGDITKDFKPIPCDSQIGDFVHELEIKQFLNLIAKENDSTHYPFSTETYRKYFRHTLWCLPGVKECKAFSKILRSHPIFSQFTIVNVAGDGDEEINSLDALSAVKNAITAKAHDTRTITLTCGRLTTGVSIPEWTAVIMLAGSYSTEATRYLQTIFRVQTPAKINGKTKENCYVFDFAPDRTLKMVAESVQLSSRASHNETSELRLSKFLNFCSVVSIDSAGMKEYKVSYLLQELKKAYAERVVRNGFDDTKLYNNELLRLNELDIQEFNRLKGIIGASKASSKTKEIDINSQGFKDEQYEQLQELKNKKKDNLSDEEKTLLEEYKKRKKEKENAISILRGISIRIPLLVYGADVPLDQEINIQNFPKLVDDLSWEEFMPKGVTKEDFVKFSKYYDKDIFIASAYRIRNIARAADELDPIERTKKIASLFSTFKNPDKETVLTPWRVVNLHLSSTIGGYDYFDEEHINTLDKPRYIEVENVTSNLFDNPNLKILDINSKTGLYPLYLASTFYLKTLERANDSKVNIDAKYKLWADILNKNIFVICKSPMAKAITQRTLAGFYNFKINAHAFDDIFNQIKHKRNQLIEKLKSASFWNKEEDMKFNAVVGNPPYQVATGGGQAQATPIYDQFTLTGLDLKPDYMSLIIPSRWFAGGFPVLDKLRHKFIEEQSLVTIHSYFEARDLFPSVDIKGGICYFLYKNAYRGKTEFINHKYDGTVSKLKRFIAEEGLDIIVRDNEAISILNKVRSKGFRSFSDIVSPLQVYSSFSAFKTFNKEKQEEDDYFAYILKDTGWVAKSEIVNRGGYYLNKYKVFVPRAVGSADVTKDRINPIIGEPNSVCSNTYIVIGPFDTKEECENVISYINTKFFHFLLSLKKVSQDNLRGTYAFIPLIPFDIEYNDDTLNELFDLTTDERNYINELVWS